MFVIINATHADRRQLYESPTPPIVMLAYPIVYCIFILTLSIVRWFGFVQESKNGSDRIVAAAIMTVVSIYTCSGAATIVLLLATRLNSFGYRAQSKYGPRKTSLSAMRVRFLGRVRMCRR
ncbi:hypothetical protein H2248_005265 [Termitomyces sp. 'cryptogamus']|nr:hypothetical protein H2248_005265 [Termitomyces sp. 'cryptogamus']